MIKYLTYLTAFLLLLSACKSQEKPEIQRAATPVVTQNGEVIRFANTESAGFFKTEKVIKAKYAAEFSAPAKIAATVVSSGEGANQNIILFDNPDLAGTYTQLIQHQIGIKKLQDINLRQMQLELDRTRDLHDHGVATGRDLLNAQTELAIEQTNLANEKTALIEHESKLISAGFTAGALRKAKPGTVFLISEVPENMISKIKEGSPCAIVFNSYPGEVFTGEIDAIAEMIDNISRMVKVRIRLNNSSSKLKAGMYAKVSLNLSDDETFGIDSHSLVTIQGNTYAFVKTDTTTFKRRKIETGQQIGEKIIVLDGLEEDEQIAIEGVMQLKGLSFGY